MQTDRITEKCSPENDQFINDKTGTTRFQGWKKLKIKRWLYCLRVSPIELMIHKKVQQSYNCVYEQRKKFPWWNPRTTGTLMSSPTRALTEGLIVWKKQQSERDGTREPNKSRLSSKSFSPSFRPVPSCLEPVAFHKIVVDMLCISGDFPHSWIWKVGSNPVWELRQRFFKQYKL